MRGNTTFMKIAIVRTSSGALKLNSYNVQEIGLSKALIKSHISIDIYSKVADETKINTLIEENGQMLRLIPIKGFTLFRQITFYPRLISRVVKESYDFVQVHEDSQFMTPLIIYYCKKNGIKTILYQGMYNDYKGMFSYFQKIFDLIFKNIISKNVNIIFAKTDIAKDYLLRKGYRNVHVLPIGLDIKEKERTESSHGEKLEKFKSIHEKILLYVGSIEQRRNPIFLIDVFSQVKSQENVGLIIVGEGPLNNELLQHISKKQLNDHVLIVKSIPNNEIHYLYKNSDVLLLPTNNEIYGMVIMEALFNGIPVVSTHEAGPSFILKDIKLGKCLDLSHEKWSEIIRYYLSNENSLEDKNFRKKYIKNNFNWERISIEYYKHLNEL